MDNPMTKSEIYREEISLASYVNILVRRKVIVIIPFLISIILTFIIYIKSPVVFGDEAVIKIGSFSKPLMSVSSATWAMRNQHTLTDIISKYKLTTSINELKSMFDSGEIKITSLDPGFLKITVESNNPEKTRSITKALASDFLERGNVLFSKRKIFLENQLKGYQESKTLRKNPFVYQTVINNLSLIYEELFSAEEFEVIEFPSLSTNQIIRKKNTKSKIIPVLGLSLGVIFAFLQEFWVNNFKKHD